MLKTIIALFCCIYTVYSGSCACQNQAAVAGPTCPSGWIYYDVTQSCYFKGRMQSWLSAERYCVGQNAHLASIHSKAEADFVNGLAQIDGGCLFCSKLNQRYRMWIGGFVNAGAYVWSDSTPFDYQPYTLPIDRSYYISVNIDSDCIDDPQSAFGNWIVTPSIDQVNDVFICKIAANV
ncbi:unnamed protein product, partial [Mesorhabditis spiculigera]